MSDLKYLELHGERVAYRERGHGPALLLIHGMAGSSETWRAVIPQLSKRYRVIAPDLMGHGQSAKPRGDYSLGAFAVWLRDLLMNSGSAGRRWWVSPWAVVWLAVRPSAPRLLRTAGADRQWRPGSGVGWTLRLLSAPGAELLLPAIAPPAVVAAGDQVRSWRAVGRSQVRAARDLERLSSLSDRPARAAFLRTLRSVVDHRGQAVSAFDGCISRPASHLVDLGDHDRIIPVAHAHAAHDALPGSRIVILPGVGHYPHLEAGDAVIDTLNDFCATTTPWQRRRRTQSAGATAAFAAETVSSAPER